MIAANRRNYKNCDEKKDTLDCKLCNFEFSDQSQLMEHIRNHHQDKIVCDNTTKLNIEEGETAAPNSVSFLSEKKIQTKPNAPIKCKHCNFVSRNESNMLLHVRALHRAISDWCEVCKKVFLDLEQLVKHTVTHMTNLYQCNSCKSSFKTKTLLIRHERIHTGEKPFDCPECDKSFSRKHSLKTHQVVHGKFLIVKRKSL